MALWRVLDESPRNSSNDGILSFLFFLFSGINQCLTVNRIENNSTGSAQVHLAEARGFAPRHYSSSLVIALLLLYFSHFYYFIVAFTPGLQTTVSSVVWSACICYRLLYRLQADFQPVRIPFQQRQNKTNRQKFACSFCLAEARGFEPLSP